MITIGKKWTDKELKYLRDNMGTISAYQMAKKLGRPNTTVWEKVKRLKESECELKKPAALTTAQKLEALEERFKNPLLRVAVFRDKLSANWTPIDRLSDLVLYNGIYQIDETLKKGGTSHEKYKRRYQGFTV